ncbi:MAG: hypothetical protein IPP77_04035 [Bacteroidetes bacterium]|nr:hypothetical protein [Bacteroidota bacterium]
MKNIYAFLVLTMVVLNSRAQFSSDNLHPMALCNATGNQTNIQVLDDGSGGYFVFWLDNRLDAGKKQVYAQHLDQDGLAQWAADGKVLTDTGRNTTGYRVAAWQSGVLLSWFQQGFTNAHDTVFCKYISSAGSDLWAQPTTVAYSGNGFLYMDLPGFNIFPNDSGAFIVHSYTYTGGSSGLTYNRIDFNGNLRWPALSKTQTLYGYDYRSQTDNQNGFCLVERKWCGIYHVYTAF